MKIICSWCKKTIQEENEENKNNFVSHGMCKKCYDEIHLELEEAKNTVTI